MKILHLISSQGFYGAENVVAGLARDLQHSGHSVRIGVFDNLHTAQNHVADEFESRGLQVIRIRCRSRLDFATVRRIREIIAIQGINLVHSHGYKSDIYALLACRRMGLPLLATSHHWTHQTRTVRFYEFLDGLTLRRFDAIVAVSKVIAGELCEAGVPADKITVIDNGIDLTPFNSAAPVLKSELNATDQLLIGTVGRLVAQKGMIYFLAAAQQLLKEFPNLTFVIAGNGPDLGKLQQLAKELHIESKVRFTGVRYDMPNVYASLDVFALGSIAEGMPMALLEAMASRLPVAATAVGAVPQIVIPGETGILVKAREATELAQAIAALVRDPALRERLGANGQRKVHERFSSQVMSQNYYKLYTQLLEQKRAGLSQLQPRMAVGVGDGGPASWHQAPTQAWPSGGDAHGAKGDERRE